MPRAILHIDMDAFYASVEQRDNPELRGLPLIVGGHPTRGVVLAASYQVRPFGVRSAMPMSMALRLAPMARVVPPRFAAYVEASEALLSIFETYTPLVEPLSLDEAFLDVTASVRLFGAPDEIASKIRHRIKGELSLPASAGVATTKFVAKIASDLAKPDGQRSVPVEQTVSFLAQLPIARLWGVGRKLEQQLRGWGIATIGDLAARRPEWLAERLGIIGPHLWQLSQGLDEREVIPDRKAKSIGAEDTFEEDLEGPEAVRMAIHAQSLRVARRLRRAGLKGSVIQLKVKLADFTLVTRQTTLAAATDDGQEIYRTAMDLMSRLNPLKKMRLTGVSAHGFERAADQLQLFSHRPNRAQKLNAALDEISRKFGSDAIQPADLLPPSSDAAQ